MSCAPRHATVRLGCVGITSAALLVLSCDKPPTPAPGSDSASTGSATATASVPTPAPSSSARYPRVPTTPASRPACRALALTGDVKSGDKPLSNGAIVYGDTWLTLAKDASISLRHTVTTRELTLKGPAYALPCIDGDEDTVLGMGTLSTSAGAGARPGAVVTVFTPLGTVSYGDAQITIRASKSKAEIVTTKGEGWVRAAKGATRAGPEKVTSPKDKSSLSGSGPTEALVVECERAAAEAAGLARAVLDPAAADGGSLGERAAKHLEARQRARWACGVALAGAAAETDADKRKGLESRVEAANARWRSLGTPGSPAPKSSAQ
ncbi:MAG: hypothetical protein IPI67_02605 [Myxococcales bacterium]|nr:hypothetical protein [Myxococcales bacterium]